MNIHTNIYTDPVLCNCAKYLNMNELCMSALRCQVLLSSVDASEAKSSGRTFISLGPKNNSLTIPQQQGILFGQKCNLFFPESKKWEMGLDSRGVEDRTNFTVKKKKKKKKTKKTQKNKNFREEGGHTLKSYLFLWLFITTSVRCPSVLSLPIITCNH